MTVDELIDELLRIKSRSPGNAKKMVCFKRELERIEPIDRVEIFGDWCTLTPSLGLKDDEEPIENPMEGDTDAMDAIILLLEKGYDVCDIHKTFEYLEAKYAEEYL